jgi:hypothetical protein
MRDHTFRTATRQIDARCTYRVRVAIPFFQPKLLVVSPLTDATPPVAALLVPDRGCFAYARSYARWRLVWP